MAEKKKKTQSAKVNKVKAEKRRIEKKKKERQNDENRVRLFVKGKSLDFGLLAIVLVLLTVGLIMLLSASSPYSLRTEGDSNFYFKKQLAFAGAGVVLMLIVSKIDYRIFNSRISWLAYLGGLRIHVACLSATELVLEEMMH